MVLKTLLQFLLFEAIRFVLAHFKTLHKKIIIFVLNLSKLLFDAMLRPYIFCLETSSNLTFISFTYAFDLFLIVFFFINKEMRDVYAICLRL